jgi:hypothetical protein
MHSTFLSTGIGYRGAIGQWREVIGQWREVKRALISSCLGHICALKRELSDQRSWLH